VDLSPPPADKEVCMGCWPGHWAVYSICTYHSNIHVLLPFSPDEFSGVKLVRNALEARTPSKNPRWGSSQHSPDPIARLNGKGTEGKRREDTSHKLFFQVSLHGIEPCLPLPSNFPAIAGKSKAGMAHSD